MAPLQTVYSVQSRSFCLVKNGDNYETREVVIDGDNSKMVLFKDGVKVGDDLVMNPGAYKDRMDLPKVLSDESIQLPDNVTLVKVDEDQRDGPPESGRRGGPPGAGNGGGGGRSASGMAEEMMAKYDVNGDGTIDETEMENLEGRAKILIGDADGNGDGQVSKVEMQKMATKTMSQRSGGGGPRGGGGPGANPAAGSEESSGSKP